MTEQEQKLINIEKKTELSSEHIERLDRNPDKAVELSPRDAESRAEKARNEALENAVSVETRGRENEKPKETSGRRGPLGSKQREASFKQTMDRVQTELRPNSRVFSKFIHNKAVEKTSDIVGNTVARPNAILTGSISAFLLTLLFYTIAKTVGYPLSGSETMIAFGLGWLIGVIIDYFKVMITGKRF